MTRFIEQKSDHRIDLEPFLAAIHPEGTPFELRFLNAKTRGVPGTASGVFDDPAAAARATRGYDGNYKGLYFTLNPTTRPVTNKIGKAEETTKDEDVPARRWLLIDVEGSRPNPKETNATDEEVMEAIELAWSIRETVWQASPLVLCSGNGCHLLYRIDLPNTPETRTLCQQALLGLAAASNNEGATVDPKVFNAARISKLAGTMTRKGEHLEDRPQRYAFVLDWDVQGVLPAEQLEEWASWAPAGHKEGHKEESQKPEATKSVIKSTQTLSIGKDDREDRARKWLEKRDPAVSGSGGDDWTYATASAVFIDFDLSEAQALTVLSEWNQRCSPPWDSEDLEAFVRKADKYATGTRGQKLAIRPPGWNDDQVGAQDDRLNGFQWNDWGNAMAIVYMYGERLRWCTTAVKWMCWVKTHWRLDAKNKALAWANKTTLARVRSAALLEDEEQREKAVKYFKGCLSTKTRNSMLEQVKAWEPCLVVSEELDKDKWLLNFKNGTLDLKTGILRRHNQDDLITKLVSVEYDPTAQCPKWLAFLEKIMDGNQDMIGYLQRAAGYSLTGDTREQCLFLCFGGGKNGKSVFLEVLGDILSNYSVQSPSSTFRESTGDKIPNDIARLKGTRFVRCVETDEELVFNEGLIKQMTGSDTLSARFMRGEWFDFKPEFKLWFATNHKPRVKGTDDGVWRRMRIIPWSVQIAEHEVDNTLEGKLKEEAAGIMAWAVKGCQEWQRNGLQEPEQVTKETAAYRIEMDILQQWIEECCTTGPYMTESNAILWKYYRDWASPKGIPFGNEISFGRRLGLKGYKPCKINWTRGREGIRVDLRVKKTEPLEQPVALDDAELQATINGFNL